MATVRAKKISREQDEVFIMEARLKLLKEQMEIERKKREDLVKKNGSGSVWMNGRAGAMRSVRDVHALVRTNARERAQRPASAISAAETASPSPSELDENAINNRLWTPGAGDSNWTSAQRAADGMACGPDTPLGVNGSTSPETALQEPVEVAAMECQTEPMGRARWSGKGNSASAVSRPSTGAKRAVAKTYLSKILDARKKQAAV